MYTQRMALCLTLALIPGLAVSQLLTVTRYASTCSASYPDTAAIYTSGTNTFTLPSAAPTSTYSASPSSGTSAARVALCPEFNGQNHTIPMGGTFGVHCDLAITGTRLSGLQGRQANADGQTSQQNCIVACRRSAACVALTISPSSCEYFSNVTGTVDTPGAAALIKIRAPLVLTDVESEHTTAVTSNTTVITLPNNLGTLFGGVDATKSFRDAGVTRNGLWNLGGLNDDQYEVQTVYGDDKTPLTYHIPTFLSFTWGSQLASEIVYGETKSEYQHKLSSSFAANVGFAGFGAEIEDTFEEDSLVETYHKYASMYVRQQIYRVAIRESPSTLQSFLSDRARRLFASGDAKVIVDNFGTHYMTSANFGGMKRFASTLDVRDDAVSEKLGQALSIKVAAETEVGEVKGGTRAGNSDETVNKIHDSMDVRSTVVLGGTYIEDRQGDWIPSLYLNPSVIDFELASIADLIMDPAIRASVQKEIDSRIQRSQVTSTALTLVMWEQLGDPSGFVFKSFASLIATASVKKKQGWFTLGQYMTRAFRWNPTLSKGLLIRNVPGSTRQYVKQPTRVERPAADDTYGLYEMTMDNDPDWHAMSGFLYSNDNAQLSDLTLVERAAMLHTDLTLSTTPGIQLWGDPDVQTVYYGASDDDSVRIQQYQDGQPEAFFFHTNEFNHGRDLRRLDFSKVQFVTNNFINPP